MEQISLVYDGGLAATGQLDFYEYSRAAYGLARLVTTIEHFRRTGRVAQRVSFKTDAGLIIRAPQRGSFPLDILIPVAHDIVNQVLQHPHVPIGVFVKYIVHLVKRILPKDEDRIVKLAELELRRDEQNTARSSEETKRLREVRRIVETHNVTLNTAITLLDRLSARQDSIGIDIFGSRAEVERVRSEFREAKEREEGLNPYKRHLEAIDESSLVSLTRKVRPQLQEVGLPLRKSASRVAFSGGREHKQFASFDRETIADVNSRALDQRTTIVELRMFAYDRDTGHGRCDLMEHDMKRVSFSVPVNLRSRLRKKVLDSIDQDAVMARVRFFRNKDNQITSILLEDILPL
jgi:hypothetical protein